MNTATKPLTKVGALIGSMAFGLSLATTAPAAQASAAPTAVATSSKSPTWVGDRSYAWASASSKSVCGTRVRRTARGVAYARRATYAEANRASTKLARADARRNARAIANRYVTARRGALCNKGSSIVGKAAALKGRPYRWGATGPSAFDCSGYVGYVYRKATGKRLPRTSGAIAAAGRRVSSPRPGDIAVFSSGGRVYHVGIYAGGGTMWHSPKPGSSVRKEAMWGGRYFVRY